MTWLHRYQIWHYVTNSIWVWPVLSMGAAMFAAWGLHWLEESMGWESALPPDTAHSVLGTLASAMFTFVVFVSSALLVAMQLASSQLTPRIIGIVYRDRFTQVSLLVFVFTFTFTLAVLVRITTSVPLLTTQLAAYSCLVGLAVFLCLIDHVGKSLRPSGALWAVASMGREVIENVYPVPLRPSIGSVQEPTAQPFGKPGCIVPSRKDGVVLAFDIHGLVRLAQRADCVIELVPQVGDFVASGDPLFRVHGKHAAVPVDALSSSVAVGQERTVEQDPAFAFRILVDIASKGLSPAINDPTTAVLALNHIHHLLRMVGSRSLDTGRVRDTTGQLRLVYRTPDWVDFVELAVTEIRHFGSSSIQVARRMRAMLEDLIQTLPAERVGLLRQELELLRRSTERFFLDPADRALAEVSDSLGVGGTHDSGPEHRGQAGEPTPGQPVDASMQLSHPQA